jgi:hypothetical protein
MTTEQILVQKRNSREKEPLNIEKIHQMVEFACEDISGVSASQVEMKSGYNFLMVYLQIKYNRFLLSQLQI